MEEVFGYIGGVLRAWVLPFGVVVVVAAFGYWLLGKAFGQDPNSRLYRQLAYVGIVLVALVGLILVIPVDTETRGQLLGLYGIVVTAVIALSSTTFVSNAMAGLMLKAMGSYHTGDFIRVADHFGRVTARALLHTELQNEDRDLVSLPNLFVITNPVQVVDESGTLISAEVSIGFDVHRHRIRELLLDAAERTELTDAFTRIVEIGNFAVVYRVTGFLDDATKLVSKRSELKGNVLDALHDGGVEIMTPSVMSQRPLTAEARVAPALAQTPQRALPEEAETGRAESIMFDKAEFAVRVERLRDQARKLADEVKALTAEGSDANAAEIAWREHQIESLNEILSRLDEQDA